MPEPTAFDYLSSTDLAAIAREGAKVPDHDRRIPAGFLLEVAKRLEAAHLAEDALAGTVPFGRSNLANDFLEALAVDANKALEDFAPEYERLKGKPTD